MNNKGISFKVDSLKLVGEVFSPSGKPGQKFPALCLCHGIPAKAYVPGDPGYPALARTFCDLGILTMIFNFRGAGLSEGNFDMFDWTKDLSGAVDFLSALPEVDKSRLFLMGFSGGAAAAVYVAAADARVKALVTCACPARFVMVGDKAGRESFIQQAREVGTIKDPGFPVSSKGWADNFKKIDPIKFISHVSPRPLLIIHGDSDDVVPVNDARQIFRRAGEPKELVIITGANHRLRLYDRAMDKARAWVKARL